MDITVLSPVFTSRHRMSTQAGKIARRIFVFKRWRIFEVKTRHVLQGCIDFFEGTNNIKAKSIFTIFIKIRVKTDSIKSSIKEFYLSMFGYFDRKKNQIAIYLIQHWMFFFRDRCDGFCWNGVILKVSLRLYEPDRTIAFMYFVTIISSLWNGLRFSIEIYPAMMGPYH